MSPQRLQDELNRPHAAEPNAPIMQPALETDAAWYKELEGQADGEKGQFCVRDDQSANYIVRKILEEQAYINRVQEWARQEVAVARGWWEMLQHRYGPQLEQWVRRRIEECGGRRRSFKLPAGMIGLRKHTLGLSITHLDITFDWCCRNLPDAIKVSVEATGAHAEQLKEWQRSYLPDADVEPRISLAKLIKHAKTTGEIPEGVTVEPAHDELFIKETGSSGVAADGVAAENDTDDDPGGDT